MRALDDLVGDDPAVKNLRPLERKPPQHCGVFRIAELIPGAQRPSIGTHEERPNVPRWGQNKIRREVARKTRRHREAIGRRAYRRGKKLTPGANAIALLHCVQKRNRSRHTGRAAGAHGLQVRQWPALCIEKHVGRGAEGRLLASVDGGNNAALSVVVQHEAATGDPGALRFDKAEHRLDGNGRVRGTAALAQNLGAGIGRERVGSGHHGARGLRRRLRGARKLRRIRRHRPDGTARHRPHHTLAHCDAEHQPIPQRNLSLRDRESARHCRRIAGRIRHAHRGHLGRG